MFGRTERDTVYTRTVEDRPFRARGGVSGGAVLTGTVVAFGAMTILSVLIGAVLVGLGLQEGNISQQEAIQAGIWTGIGIVIAQFLSYLWGGYTAGRMARGSGFINGLLVPILAIVLAGLVLAVAGAIGYSADTSVSLPFSTDTLPWNNDNLQDWTIGLGIATLVAMFLGAILGGLAGQRWHTKLENRVFDEEVVDDDSRTVDVREGTYAGAGAYSATDTSNPTVSDSTTTPPPPPAASTTYGDRSNSTTTIKR
jgi:hypothetical protein